MNVRNMKYSRDGNIDCEIEHPAFGWIAFTASPADCEEAGRELFAKLVAGEFGEIEPAAAPTREKLCEEVEAARLRAYADPITGSDRYFAEAQRETLLGNAEAADAAKALGLARFSAIQAEYPWPAE